MHELIQQIFDTWKLKVTSDPGTGLYFMAVIIFWGHRSRKQVDDQMLPVKKIKTAANLYWLSHKVTTSMCAMMPCDLDIPAFFKGNNMTTWELCN